MKLKSLFALMAFAVGITLGYGQGWIRDFTLFPPIIPKVISHWQVRVDVFHVMNPSQDMALNLVVMDTHYVLPSYTTAMKLIAAATKKVDRRYVVNAWDCEDVSQQFISEIRRLARVETREFPSGFPAALVGVHVYAPIPEFKWSGGEYPYGHAMVAIRIDDGRWLLVEPQNGKVVDITAPIYEGQINVVLVIL